MSTKVLDVDAVKINDAAIVIATNRLVHNPSTIHRTNVNEFIKIAKIMKILSLNSPENLTIFELYIKQFVKTFYINNDQSMLDIWRSHLRI
jgi:hypothetical protein